MRVCHTPEIVKGQQRRRDRHASLGDLTGQRLRGNRIFPIAQPMPDKRLHMLDRLEPIIQHLIERNVERRFKWHARPAHAFRRMARHDHPPRLCLLQHRVIGLAGQIRIHFQPREALLGLPRHRGARLLLGLDQLVVHLRIRAGAVEDRPGGDQVRPKHTPRLNLFGQGQVKGQARHVAHPRHAPGEIRAQLRLIPDMDMHVRQAGDHG